MQLKVKKGTIAKVLGRQGRGWGRRKDGPRICTCVGQKLDSEGGTVERTLS